MADLPIYEEEKPYYLHASASAGEHLDDIKFTNIEWGARLLTAYSMRDNPDISLERNGFCYVEHKSDCIPTAEGGLSGVAKYRRYCEALLRGLFQAEFVHCCCYKARKNAPIKLDQYDPNNPLVV